MKYKLFKKELQKYPYFTSAIYNALAGSKKTLYNQMDKWVKTGDVIRLKKGLFTLNDSDRSVGLSEELLTSALGHPN